MNLVKFYISKIIIAPDPGEPKEDKGREKERDREKEREKEKEKEKEDRGSSGNTSGRGCQRVGNNLCTSPISSISISFLLSLPLFSSLHYFSILIQWSALCLNYLSLPLLLCPTISQLSLSYPYQILRSNGLK